MKNKLFKSGDYVTDGCDVYYVLGRELAWGEDAIEVECVRSGNTSIGEGSHYTKCRKPKTFKQEHLELCKKFGLEVAGSCTVQTKAFKRFSNQLISLLRKHGDSIYN